VAEKTQCGFCAVRILKISYEDEGGVHTIHPVLLDDAFASGDKILIDCGYAGFLPLLERAAAEQGAQLEGLAAVIITHHDPDHVGALAELTESYPGIRVMASEEDAPCVSGIKPSPRLALAAAHRESLTEERRREAKAYEAEISATRPVRVDRLLKDGDVFPWCGGTEIIATPGHVPGHISVYLRGCRTLIAGDALIVNRGRLRAANPRYSVDPAEAGRSAKKLARLGAERVICFHGGVYVHARPSLAQT